MIEIIKVYKQSVNKLRFIGKKYDNANRVDGSFGVKVKWDEWFEHNWFKIIEDNISSNYNDTFEDGNAYIGLLRNKPKEPFQYWIGMFTPENTQVPIGFKHIDFPKSELGVCWVCGKKEHVCFNEGIEIFEQCNEKLKNEGMDHIHDNENVYWIFERYSHTRSKVQDENGKIIIDICCFLHFDIL